MGYIYNCSICGEKFTGDSEDGLVVAAKQHYMNQHGIQYESGEREANLQYSEDDIREDIGEE
jgi:hypothetical protein